jgi:hypothetical protein
MPASLRAGLGWSSASLRDRSAARPALISSRVPTAFSQRAEQILAVSMTRAAPDPRRPRRRIRRRDELGGEHSPSERSAIGSPSDYQIAGGPRPSTPSQPPHSSPEPDYQTSSPILVTLPAFWDNLVNRRA